MDGISRALSLAQVEEELRSAEAYLTAGGVPPPPVTSLDAPPPIPEHHDRPEREDLDFRRKLRTRPVLSEERRREILAKLSSERQAALRGRIGGQVLISEETLPSGTAAHETKYKTPEERDSLIQNLLNERNFSRLDAEIAAEPAECSDGSPYQRSGSGLSGESSDDEIYYASDILGNASADDIQPRSKLDFIFEEKDDADMTLAGKPPLALEQEPSPTRYSDEGEAVQPVTSSLLAKLIAQASNEQHENAELPRNDENDFRLSEEAHQFDNVREDMTNMPASLAWQAVQQYDDEFSRRPTDTANHQAVSGKANSVPRKKISSRIDYLAQPRNQAFVEREKQRVQLEMEQLRECTFRPNVLKPPQTMVKSRAGSAHDLNGRPGTTAFQWLTLSPRQKSHRWSKDISATGKENDSQNVINRLHLDGTGRYESRERAREALEAKQLQECTFKPRINETSKSMFVTMNYKPIQYRISDLQRAKVECVERIREQLDVEKRGPLSFTPSINPKSRELASNKLAAIEAEDFMLENGGKTKAQKVTERLTEEAEGMVERRLATQEYFDMLNEQSFTPEISETSRRIVKLKPEFQMDFVSRQQYFQARDQEKMETLEDFCDTKYAHGEGMTFKPDIGNANAVLEQLRPNRCAESSEQKLYRLTYDDQREAELKKQRLREEQYGQYTFKPEINPISKALGKSSTLDELSHPVLDVLPCSTTVGRRSSAQERKNGASDASTSRAALRQYFANKRFRSRVALEMEEASKAECTFQPTLVASRKPSGSNSTSKLHSREPRSRTKLQWQSENLLHLIEAERQKKADEIEAKRNAQELKELEECTFRPNTHKGERSRKSSSTKNSPSPPRKADEDEKPVIVRGLGRFLELRDRARQQQAEQKQREQKVFSPNANYEPRTYTVPKPFKLSETSKESIKRRLKVREDMRAKERQECTFHPNTISSQRRRVLQNMLND